MCVIVGFELFMPLATAEPLCLAHENKISFKLVIGHVWYHVWQGRESKNRFGGFFLGGGDLSGSFRI